MKKIDTEKKERNWRSEEMHQSYMDSINKGHLDDGCVLCKDTSIMDFEYWRIIDNLFPYDTVSEVHHMILPKDHIKESDLPQEALKEFSELKTGYLNEEYNFVLEALPKDKSIPAHHHLHLIKAKKI